MKKSIIVVLLSFSFILIADDMKEKLNTIKFQDISFKNTSYHSIISFLFMDLRRMSSDANPSQIYNYIQCLPDDDFDTIITFKSKNVSLKTLLDKICKQAKLTYNLQGKIILIGKNIANDDNFFKIKSFNDIKIEHAEFEDCSLSVIFNYLKRIMNKKRKKKEQIILTYIRQKKKEISKKKENKIAEDKKSIKEKIGNFEFEDEDDDWNDEEEEEPESLSLIVDDIPAGTLISYICRLANLEYTVNKNKITIKHTTKVTPLDQNSVPASAKASHLR